jgi:GT2 family glycosyltransferase
MATKHAELKSAPNTPNRQAKLLDLLAEPMQEGPGIRRDGNDFIVDQAWSIARFGQITLRRGWWTFECEGEGDVGGVELRLVSPEDTLLAFSLRRNARERTLLHTDKAYDVSLLASAWPGRVRLTSLRMRRLSRLEQVRLAGAMLLRLAQSNKPLSKLTHILSRVIAGRSLRIRSAEDPAPKATRSETSTNAGGEMRAIVTGDVTAVLREDEQLHPRAMEIVANAFARSANLQAVYADLAEGERIRPRPDWDADLAAVSNYVGSPMFFRGEATASEAWCRLMMYSATEGGVARIALPLGSRKEAIEKSMVPPPIPHLHPLPLVSVVVPTKIRIDLLERCLEGLVQRTDYPALEVIVVNGAPGHPRVEQIIASASAKLRLRTVDDSGSFNFSRLINLGVRSSQGDVVLLLNDDVEAIEVGWLHRMVESAMVPSVGCVGARLLYPDRTIQHAGVTLGLSGVCGHLWKGLSTSEAALIPQVVLPSQRMAVTGACLAVRRELFERVGGLDEINYPVALNDVDFCLRVRALGYRTIYRGDAVLIHHEGQSRGLDDATMQSRKRLTRETSAFLGRWGELLLDDPFGSPAFDPLTERGTIHPSLREEAARDPTSAAHMPRQGE